MSTEEIIRVIKALEIQAQADACHGCRYFENTEDWEMPCKECCRSKKDYWRAK